MLERLLNRFRRPSPAESFALHDPLDLDAGPEVDPISPPPSLEDDQSVPDTPESPSFFSRLVARLNPTYISPSEAQAHTSSSRVVDLDESDPSPYHFLVSAAGRRFVSGVEWSDGTSALGRSIFQAKDEYPLNSDLTFFYVRKVLPSRSHEQYGIATSSSGASSSCYSLAQLVSTRAGDSSFVALFELDDGSWYFVAGREGVIRPQTDLCLPASARSDLVAHARRLLSQRGIAWDHIIAPDILGLDGSTSANLKDILEGPLPSRISYLYPPFKLYLRYATIVGILLVVLFSSITLYRFGMQWIQGSTQAQHYISQVSKLVLDHVPKIPSAPWEDTLLPTPPGLLDYCVQHLSDVRVYGWSPTEFLSRGELKQSVPIGGYSLSTADCKVLTLNLILSPVLQSVAPSSGPDSRVYWPILMPLPEYSGPQSSLSPIFFSGDPLVPETGLSPFEKFLSHHINSFQSDTAFSRLSTVLHLGSLTLVTPESDLVTVAWGIYPFSLQSPYAFHKSAAFRTFLTISPGLLLKGVSYNADSGLWLLSFELAAYTVALKEARAAAQRNAKSLAKAQALDDERSSSHSD